MRSLHWISIALLGFAIASGAWFLLRRHESIALRAEIASLQQQNRRLADLRVEHQRLLAAKISDPELARLRNDHAALQRLRAEIDQLNESADRKARAVEAGPEKQAPLLLKLEMARDGGLSLDGAPTDDEGLRQLFTRLAERSEKVDLRLRFDPSSVDLASMKKTIEGLVKMSKDARLRMSLQIEKPEQVR